jgi:hypothetical protein
LRPPCAAARFPFRLARHLNVKLPLLTNPLGPDGLAARIRAAIPRAAARGVTTERGLAAWATLDLVLGPAFDTLPEVAAVFADDDPMPAEERVIALLDAVAEADAA